MKLESMITKSVAGEGLWHGLRWYGMRRVAGCNLMSVGTIAGPHPAPTCEGAGGDESEHGGPVVACVCVCVCVRSEVKRVVLKWLHAARVHCCRRAT